MNIRIFSDKQIADQAFEFTCTECELKMSGRYATQVNHNSYQNICIVCAQ